jgi:putative two-component system response regulator
VILIVDDSRDNATALARLLRRAGYESTYLDCGPDLFTHLRDHPKPRLIILDLMMPQVDGFACLQQLRGSPDWRDIPVLIYSADFDHNHLRQTMELGAQDYVVKGTKRWEELLAIIEKHAGVH